MLFRNSYDKVYNLNNKQEKIIKNLIKEDYKLNENNLKNLIQKISMYHINQFKNIPNTLYKNQNKDLLDVVQESKELLIQIFNMNGLYKILEKNYETEKFENDDEFRRKVMSASLYKIIDCKSIGPEYGLIFAKTFNYDIKIPMQYASYNGMFDERFIKYVDTYLGLGGTKQIYWLPNYFDKKTKDKYNMEDLSEVVNKLSNYLKGNKVNSIE